MSTRYALLILCEESVYNAHVSKDLNTTPIGVAPDTHAQLQSLSCILMLPLCSTDALHDWSWKTVHTKHNFHPHRLYKWYTSTK